MKKTVTETFDKHGNVIKRVTIEEEEFPIQPLYPAPLPILPYPYPPPTPYAPSPIPYQPVITGGTPNMGEAISGLIIQ